MHHGKAPTNMQRVKIYRLNEQRKWDDQGTGYASIDYLERSEDLGLVVIDEEDNETLLMHRISIDVPYRRQEPTIIAWKDSNLCTDLAISFQEVIGCAYIWGQINGIQRDLQLSAIGNEKLHVNTGELKKLPSIELSTLPLILKTVVESGTANQIQVAELILQEKDFFSRLFDLFRLHEGLRNMGTLRLISKLVKAIILLNSPQVFDKIFGEEFIMDVIGTLEYDPDLTEVQPHRTFLKEHAIFKEAIPIKGSMLLSKIHQTYRINYIKDVILPRIVDEGVVASLNSIVNSNNAVVVSSLRDDSSFVHELFAKMKSSKTSPESMKNLVFFLHEFCSLSKSLQLVQQLRLFRELANEGVFDIVTAALQSHDKKLISKGTDILILFLNQDTNLLKTYVTQKEGLPLLALLVQGLISDFGEDMHCQFLEIIRILLDSYTAPNVFQRESIVADVFYRNHLDQLIGVITSSCPDNNIPETSADPYLTDGKAKFHSTVKPEVLSNICELLCFCVLHHPYKIRYNFLRKNTIEKVLHLTRRREKYLVVSAVRFMKTIISCKDEHVYRHIVKNNLLKPVIDAFVSNADRYNMLHSGVLDLLEYIRRENMKTLIKYVFEVFWNQLSSFESLETIQLLKNKYEQALEIYDTKFNNSAAEPKKHTVERGLEKEEEDYFNEESDEDDSASAAATNKSNKKSRTSLSNGTGENCPLVRTVSGSLVDYDDDDDYNPPTRKLETSELEEETILRPISSPKMISPRGIDTDDLESRKKRKLDYRRSDSSCSTSSLAEPQSKNNHPPDILQNKNENTDCVEQRDNETTNNRYNGLSEIADIREPNGEEGCLLQPISDSSSENSKKGTDVGGSDPYPVR